jgi:hypothetical protein
LRGALGWQARSSEVALDLYSSSETITEYSCADHPAARVVGSVIVPVRSDKMLSTTKLKLKAIKGRQVPEHLEGASVDVLMLALEGGGTEQMGTTLTFIQVNEEAVEVNTTT